MTVGVLGAWLAVGLASMYVPVAVYWRRDRKARLTWEAAERARRGG